MSGPLNEAGERWDDDYGLDPRATATPQLSEAEVHDLESSLLLHVDGKAVVRVDHASALIRDWRALRTACDALNKSLKEFCAANGEAVGQVRVLTGENAALREQLDSAQENFTRRTEQLAQAEKEVRGVLIALGVNAIHSRPDGGAEDIYESLAISVTKLKSELARTKQHRDDLIKELQQERRP